MCYSPCLIHATQAALVRPQLLQCQTCGSQAFYVLDCCRHPDYRRVSPPPLGGRLRAWLGGLQGTVLPRLFPQRRGPEPSVSAEALDAWEARPIVVCRSEAIQVPSETGHANAVDAVGNDTVAVHR